MSLVLTRMFAYFTLLSYLVVGTVAVRVLMPETFEISVSSQYLSLFSKTIINDAENLPPVEASNMKFAEIEFPKTPVAVALKKPSKVNLFKKEVTLKQIKVASNKLPFYEPVKLAAVQFDYSLPVSLITLYKDLSIKEEIAVAEVEDKVSTKQAAVAESGTEFFEYDSKEPELPVEKEDVKKEVIMPMPEIAAVGETQSREDVIAEVTEEMAMDDLVAFDYSKAEVNENISAKTVKPEEVNITDLVGFDYSKASHDIALNKTPTVSAVSIQSKNKIQSSPKMTTQQEVNTLTVSKSLAAKTYSSELTVSLTGMDFKSVKNLNGFEIRFQDDQSLAVEDYGSGEVTLKDSLAKSKATRSITLLKRGYAPTSTDVILESGVSSVSIPVIEEETFNKEMEVYEARGPVGAILVELDDATEYAQLDVSFGKIIKLDGDLKKTNREDFRYQLFVGVQAGNAMLTYKNNDQTRVSKIVHVHEREVTYDSNYYEEVGNLIVSLYEEDLLSKEKSPLIIGSDNVKVFATDIIGKKITDNKYKIDFGKSHLGGRQYLELTHHTEPIFVGLKESKFVAVPSERFMRYILSNFEGGNLGNRCLVQVNLSKIVSKADVGSESVGSNLMTYVQMLDKDGKFYESTSDKTQKIVIVGENQGGDKINQDGRINIKLEYQDGSSEFINTYCSPNTYLVEQL